MMGDDKRTDVLAGLAPLKMVVEEYMSANAGEPETVRDLHDLHCIVENLLTTEAGKCAILGVVCSVLNFHSGDNSYLYSVEKSRRVRARYISSGTEFRLIRRAICGD